MPDRAHPADGKSGRGADSRSIGLAQWLTGQKRRPFQIYAPGPGRYKQIKLAAHRSFKEDRFRNLIHRTAQALCGGFGGGGRTCFDNL